MSYVVAHDGVIADPYVVAELRAIQAFLKGLEAQIPQKPEQPDKPDPTKPTDPNDPNKPTNTGQRWLTGPWILGIDAVGIPDKMPAYPICRPDAINSDQHNYSPPGLESAVMLEIYADVDCNLTGIRFNPDTPQRRILGIYNRGGGVLSLVNQSTDSEDEFRFDWGTSGDAGDTLDLPSGGLVWLYRDPSYSTAGRWRLFAIPAVGGSNLPPSLTPHPQFPPDYTWCSSRTSDGATLHGVGEGTPTQTFDTAAAVNATYGFGRRLNTSVVIGNGAGVVAAQAVTMPQCDPTWTYILQTGASVADVRIWVVLSTGATSNADDLGVLNYMGFRYSTVVPDSGWVGVTKDGATQAVTAQLAAIAADTLYKLKVRKSGSSVFFSVNDGAEVEQTSNLPTATSGLTWRAFVYTQAAAVKSHVFFQEHLKHSTSA